jgi:hypothetical protein
MSKTNDASSRTPVIKQLKLVRERVRDLSVRSGLRTGGDSIHSFPSQSHPPSYPKSQN